MPIDLKWYVIYISPLPGRSVVKLNCITTIEGVYQFSYEVGGSTSLGGICNEPRSRIEACQDPGSAYVDNRMFLMNYAKCRDVSTSVDQRMYLFLGEKQNLMNADSHIQ